MLHRCNSTNFTIEQYLDRLGLKGIELYVDPIVEPSAISMSVKKFVEKLDSLAYPPTAILSYSAYQTISSTVTGSLLF